MSHIASSNRIPHADKRVISSGVRRTSNCFTAGRRFTQSQATECPPNLTVTNVMTLGNVRLSGTSGTPRQPGEPWPSRFWPGLGQCLARNFWLALRLCITACSRKCHGGRCCPRGDEALPHGSDPPRAQRGGRIRTVGTSAPQDAPCSRSGRAAKRGDLPGDSLLTHTAAPAAAAKTLRPGSASPSTGRRRLPGVHERPRGAGGASGGGRPGGAAVRPLPRGRWAGPPLPEPARTPRGSRRWCRPGSFPEPGRPGSRR